MWSSGTAGVEGSASVLCMSDGPSPVIFLLVSLIPPSNLDYEADLIFREEAYFNVTAARSWIPFRHLSPDCYRIPFDAVLRRYVRWTERSDAGEYVDLAEFWEELLEEHGFESDRQWEIRQKEYLPAARELVISRFAPQIKAPNGKESWRGKPVIEFMHDPEFWEIFPAVKIISALDIEEYRKAHPEWFGEIKPKSTTLSQSKKERTKCPLRQCRIVVYRTAEWERKGRLPRWEVSHQD